MRGPADRFHEFVDRRMRQAGGTGNLCQMAFALEGEVDVEAIGTRIDALGLPILLRVEQSDQMDARALFDESWSRPVPSAESSKVEVLVASGSEKSAFLLRWNHALMDAGGADHLVRILDGADPATFRLLDAPSTLLARARGRAGSLFVPLHRLAARTVLAALRRRPWSPSPDGAGGRVFFHTFDEPTSDRIRVAGGLRGNHRLMAAAAGGIASALSAGPEDVLLVPCPVDLRPPTWRGPVFANYSTNLLVRLSVGALGTAQEGASEVRSRFEGALRRREGAVLILLFSALGKVPLLVARALFGARDPSSFLYSNIVLKSGANGILFERPVTGCYLAARPSRPPGVCVMLSTWAGRLTVGVPVDGVDGLRVLRAVVARIGGEVDGWRF